MLHKVIKQKKGREQGEGWSAQVRQEQAQPYQQGGQEALRLAPQYQENRRAGEDNGEVMRPERSPNRARKCAAEPAESGKQQALGFREEKASGLVEQACNEYCS